MGSQQPKPPRYKKGDEKGDLLVLCDAVRSFRGQVKPKWWFMVQCKKCGHLQWMHQNQLDNRIDCMECYRDRQGFKYRKPKQAEKDLPFVPFERMRW